MAGHFRGGYVPRLRGKAGPLRPNFRAAIEAGDAALMIVEWYGTAGPIRGDAARLSAPASTWPTASLIAG